MKVNYPFIFEIDERGCDYCKCSGMHGGNDYCVLDDKLRYNCKGIPKDCPALPYKLKNKKEV